MVINFFMPYPKPFLSVLTLILIFACFLKTKGFKCRNEFLARMCKHTDECKIACCLKTV